ncbi:hypothetical protein G0Q06_03680 [Puniceicoccales bacterium CK1056]|uniref:Lipoprotein n=1 Tax=Oceanipulchritudo coccoides TaxID=2706888 RepID=A0A6B2LY49_9BACT|nr:hypothetical protein [Oceanipulchritudo coccoides]NDV61541.1 hypothetical protein [Oceanipulchritudo coccoides]
MKLNPLILLVVACVLMGGCTTTVPTRSGHTSSGVDFGTPVSQMEAEQLAGEWLSENLNMESPKYTWGDLRLASEGIPYPSRPERAYGYELRGRAEVIHGYWTFVGGQPYSFLINSGKLVLVRQLQPDGQWVQLN